MAPLASVVLSPPSVSHVEHRHHRNETIRRQYHPHTYNNRTRSGSSNINNRLYQPFGRHTRRITNTRVSRIRCNHRSMCSMRPTPSLLAFPRSAPSPSPMSFLHPPSSFPCIQRVYSNRLPHSHRSRQRPLKAVSLKAYPWYQCQSDHRHPTQKARVESKDNYIRRTSRTVNNQTPANENHRSLSCSLAKHNINLKPAICHLRAAYAIDLDGAFTHTFELEVFYNYSIHGTPTRLFENVMLLYALLC